MQLKIIKQGISHSFIFQNQQTYCDTQKEDWDNSRVFCLQMLKRQAGCFGFVKKNLEKSVLINAKDKDRSCKPKMRSKSMIYQQMIINVV